jgi:phosphatidylserine/phosphatidylglycerophosphate/cardiolipin synthase-like enzyme
MAARDRGRCEIYTRFSTEDFISGASSIVTLRHLKESGFPLYDLPGLHAKLVIVKGSFATIGSQNVTTNGRRRREATFATTRTREVERIWRDADGWCKERSEITLGMIEDMEALVPDLASEYEKIKARCVEADSQVRQAEERRRAEQEEFEQLVKQFIANQKTKREEALLAERLRLARESHKELAERTAKIYVDGKDKGLPHIRGSQ